MGDDAAMSDFTIDDYGAVVLLRPETDAAYLSTFPNLDQPLPWLAGAIAVERCYVSPLLHDIDAALLTWSPAAPTPMH
jgi:hypothetical protein